MPIASAMIGVPKKRRSSGTNPVNPSITITEDSAISEIGIMIGASVLNAEGSLP